MRDDDINKGVGLILVKDDCILVGIRADDDGIGGPGGHIKNCLLYTSPSPRDS